MMAGVNPNRWSMKNMHPQYQQQQQQQQPSSGFLPSSFLSPHDDSGSSSSSSLPSNLLADHDHRIQDFPQSWSQLLLGGLAAEEEERFVGRTPFEENKIENWGNHGFMNPSMIDVKQEISQSCCSQLLVHGEDESQACDPSSSNILDFSTTKSEGTKNQLTRDHSSECNSTTATGGVSKKQRLHSSSAQPPLKVRKLGDRITALHQLVSPFGKTDTASVLFEAIEYIRFLQGQIEALSSPYLGSVSSTSLRYQHSFLKDSCLKRRGASSMQDGQQAGSPKDLRSRGLCLVPVSCTDHVNKINESDNIGVDYWSTPTLGGGF